MKKKKSISYTLPLLALIFSLSVFLVITTLRLSQTRNQANLSVTNSLPEAQQLIQMVSATGPEFNKIRPVCAYGYCLFEDRNYSGVFGLATLQGFATTTEGRNEVGPTGETCDSFVVTDGSPELLHQLENNVRLGNTVNSVDGFGRLIINLRLASINKQEIAQIKSSREPKPVELIIFQEAPLGKGAGACSSATRVLEVKQLSTTSQ